MSFDRFKSGRRLRRRWRRGMGSGMNAPPRPIATPCVQVCIVDGESALCLGCYRTLTEVAGWSRLSDAERAQIMGELAARKSRIRPEKRGLVGAG